MFKSATFKLTVYYLALVMAISLLFSFALYHVATGEIRRGLSTETQRIIERFPVFQDAPGLMRPVQDAQAAADRIALRLLYINILIFIGAGIASYMLARRTLQPIEEAHRQQARFTSDVSHELRTPLTALRMESEVALIDGAASAAELRATLQSNIEEVSKMEALINNLLRLSKLEANRLQESFEPVQLTDIVTEAVQRTSRTTNERNITVRVKPVKATTHGDTESLTQLLVILIENAVKYSPNDANVTITIRRGAQPSISIQDKGIGIAREALDHVFDRFYQADGSRTKARSEGYGLGLSIAKMIADIHGATIILASRPGHGTTATVTFSK